MKNPFKKGDRVRWRTAFETNGAVACFAPPCDPSPGTVTGVGAGVHDPFPGGHVVDDPRDLVEVRHDSGGVLAWTAGSLVYEDGSRLRTAGGPAAPLVTAGIALGTGALLALGAFLAMRTGKTETTDELVERIVREGQRKGPPIGYLGPE
jgi:hypothetical protein